MRLNIFKNKISALQKIQYDDKNIVKISFVNNGLPKYIPLSDIDFKQIESEYLQGENIISSTSVWNVFEKQKNVYTYNLLFYHQSLEAFIGEKKYYLQIIKLVQLTL